jgi:hypothetical protein
VEAFTKPADEKSPEPSEKPRRWSCLTVVIVVILLLVCLGVGVFVFISKARKSSPPYLMALEQVQTDQLVIEQLGRPIKDATILPAVNYDSGRASLNFDVAGPNGKAHVRAEARMIDSQWGLTSVEVNVDGGEHLSLKIESGEGPSDAPIWSPKAEEPGASDDSTNGSPPMNVEISPPAGIDIQLPSIPQLPE